MAAVLLGVAATQTGTVRVLDLEAILGSDSMRALVSSGDAATDQEGKTA